MSLKKKIYFTSVIIVFLFALLFIYTAVRYYTGKTELTGMVKSDVLSYQITVDNPLATFETLYDSPVWDTYYDIPRLINIKEALDELRETINSDPTVSFLAPFLNGEISIFGITMDKETEQVYTAQMGYKISFLQNSGIFDLFTSLLAANVERENYPGFGTIFHLNLPEPYEDISFAIKSGYMFISRNPEAILRLLEGNTKLNENPGYVRTFPKIAETDILKFYFNPNSSGEKAAPGGDLIGNLFKVTEGISGEVSIPALNVKINGLVELNDSLLKLNPVNTVVGQNPKNSDNISLIPAGCAGFVHFNIGSFSDLYNNTLVELSKDEALYRKFMENKKFVEKNLGINLRQDFAAWIGHEITVAVFTPRTYRSSAEKAIIIQTRNKLMAMDAMERVAGALSNAYPINFNTVDYRGYQIHQIELPFYLNIFLGRLFDDMPKPFYTFVDNAFIATDEKETLELLIDSFLSDKTIETDPLYSDIVPEQSPFNIMVYANLSRGQEILNDIFSNQPEENWEDLKPYLQHAKSAVFTLTRKQNRQLDFSIELKLKERTREKMVKQWRVKIPAVMPFPPQMVFTNPDEAPDIYVFTENGYIYRYDFFGSALDETPQRKAQKFFTPPLQAEVNDESLFFISAGNKIQSFDRDLNRRMSYGSRDIISAPPLINPEKDRLYFADWSGRFYAYEISSGRLINKLELNSISRTSPLYFGDSDKITATATADGAVYFITNSGGEDKDSLTIVNTINLNEGISGNFCIVRWDRKTGLAFGTWNGIVHVIEPEMKERLTFPQKLTGRIEAGLTPVASDDQTFLVVPTTAKLIYLLDEDANTVEGWPVRTYGSIETTPGTYDFDGNGDEEILALAEDGRLYAFKINGELVRQWPIIASAMPSFYSRGTKHYMAVCDWNEKLTLWLLPRREKE